MGNPNTGEQRQLIEQLVEVAVQAPSPHNTQAWRWVASGDVLDLFADPSRQLVVSDPDGREMVIGCGAALEHLVLAAGAAGVAIEVQAMPDPGDPDHLARITIGTGSVPSPAPALVAVIDQRRTNRTSYRPDPIDPDILDRLERAVTPFGIVPARLDEERAAVVELIMEGDRRQMHDARFRHELSSWMRRAHEHAVDGMPADLLGQHGIAAEVAPLVVRTFDLGRGQAARDGELIAGSPDLWVLHTAADDRATWLATGRALTHLTLEATAAGVAHAYMNQPCEVPELRTRLAELLPSGRWPQLIVRLGYADPVHPSPRRPVSEVLTVASASGGS
jgi:hypothetical protein